MSASTFHLDPTVPGGQELPSLTAVEATLNRPPRLLMVTTSFITIRAFLTPFADHFRQRGWKVDALAEGIEQAEGTRTRFDRVCNIQLSRNPLAWSNLTRAPAQIRSFVQAGDYDLVHVHTPIASLVTRFALRNLRRRGRPKVVYTAHGFHFFHGGPWLKNTVYQTFESLGGRWTDYLVTINHEDFAAARRLRLVAPERVRYMPGIGVDTQALSPDLVPPEQVAAVRAQLSLEPQQPLFLMVANFDPGKRHRDLLQALAQLRRPYVHLAFAGVGPLQESMQSLTQQLGLQKQVHFLGFSRQIPALMRASVATVLPSEREGLPRSVMESMCLGVPVVGTQIRGLGDLLRDDCGYLFQVGNVNELTGVLARVLDDEALRQRIASHARQKIVGFDIGEVIRLHESLYAEALHNLQR